MFIRIKTTPNSPKKAIQIVESVRVGGKVSQRIIRHVGTAFTDMELLKMKELAQYIKAELEQEASPKLFAPEDLARMVIDQQAARPAAAGGMKVDLADIRETARIVVGIHKAYSVVYKQLRLDALLGPPSRNASDAKALMDLVMARIASPGSKRASVRMLSQDFGITLDLDRVYRLMDKVDGQVIERIQSCALSAAQRLLGQKVNVLFYDCTSLYFESFERDGLREYGYSKDGKFNQGQVILALMVTTAGIPMGYRLYPGNTFEGNTLRDALDDIKRDHNLEKVVFVADSAMVSKANQELLERQGRPYIIAARLKNLDRATQRMVLDKDRYKPAGGQGEGGATASFDLGGGRRLIVHHSLKRALKDAHDRQEAIDKLLKKIARSPNPATLISNFGYQRFIKVAPGATYSIDQEKIEQAARWDGLHGVVTNVAEMADEDVLQHYRSIWQVEETFRIAKNDIKVRPIFHWNPARIKAHVAICFMALCCMRWMEYQVASRYKKLSPQHIRNLLMHDQVSILQHNSDNRRFAIPANATVELKKVYQSLGLKHSDTPFIIQ